MLFSIHRKFCHWLLWKHCIQPLYKRLYTAFIAVPLECSFIANVLFTEHLVGLFALLFFAYGDLHFRPVFIWFIFSPYCSFAGFKMLSKSAYNINGTLNWRWPSWNCNKFSFAEDNVTLTYPLYVAIVLIELASYLRCSKTIQTVHAKVIRSFMQRIQRLRLPWPVLNWGVCF